MDIQSTITGAEPLTVLEVKNYLKVDYNDDDTLIGALISGVREMAEEITGRGLIAKTIVLTLTGETERYVVLPYPDHGTVDSVVLNDTDILADCVIGGSIQKIVRLPGIYYDIEKLVITYNVLGECPAGVKIALLKNIGELYEKRGNTFEGGLADLTENTIAILSRYMVL